MQLDVIIGVPASGKSTYIKNNFEFGEDRVLISPDLIREELCDGNRGDQTMNKEVWKLAFERVEDAVFNQKDIVFDATMVKSKDRKRLLECLSPQYEAYAHVMCMDDIDLIKERNKNREWPVPDFVIDRMLSQYQEPTLGEGFKGIVNHLNMNN